MIRKIDPIFLHVGIGTISLLATIYLYKRIFSKKWKLVGYLSEINFYPVKSCAVVNVDEADCNLLGLSKGQFNDRTFMITDTAGNYKSGRGIATLVNIKPSINKSILTLQADNFGDFKLDLEILQSSRETAHCNIWNDKINVIDCGKEAAQWISQVILNKNTGLKLVYYPHKKSSRSIRKKFTVSASMTMKDLVCTSRDCLFCGYAKSCGLTTYTGCAPCWDSAVSLDDSVMSNNRIRFGTLYVGRLAFGLSGVCEGAFSDGSSYMLASFSSLSDLNKRMQDQDKQITVNQFRPNFVVKGAEPHDEDNWKLVKIGDEAVFQAVLPCTRCQFVNVDPSSGIRDDEEPLKTLKKYRQVNNNDLRKIVGDSPKMGIQMGLRSQGKIKLGDPVYVTY